MDCSRGVHRRDRPGDAEETARGVVSSAQILDASHLVVFAAKNPPAPADVDRHVARTAHVRGTTAEALHGFRQMMLGFAVADVDAGCARLGGAANVLSLGVFLSACALAGVDACPMEGFQPEKYDEILGLKDKGLGAVVIATAGYRLAEDPAAKLVKSRFAVEDVIERV